MDPRVPSAGEPDMGRVPWISAAGTDPTLSVGLKQPRLSAHVFPLRTQCLGLSGLAWTWCLSLVRNSGKNI